MSERWRDWLSQAEKDLKHSENASKDGDYEWACFSTQQAAEKAVKAVFLKNHSEGWGHSVYGLLKALDEKIRVDEDIIEAAKALDKHYIPTRYPNGFDSGKPADYYTKKEAKEAIRNAGEIIKFCEGLLG